MFEHLKQLLAALVKEKSQFVIVGGVAGVAHGSSLVTNDLDICYQRSKNNYVCLIRALKKFKPQLRLHDQEGVPFVFDEKTLANGLNFTLVTTKGSIDLLGDIAGVGGFEQMIGQAEAMNLYGMNIPVISLDDLIKAKKAAGRTKDLLHLDELNAIQNLKKYP